MPGLDWLPAVSQLKSTVQLVTGDFEGAKRTQVNFAQECPGVSQVTSAVQLAVGNKRGALQTQKRCLGTVSSVANGIPVLGHIKGVVHYAAGDKKGGHHAMNAASRSTVVLGSGAGAALLSGGLAAIPAGIAAGTVYDTAGTVITDKPQGIYAAVDKVKKHPTAGNVFEAAFIPMGDGVGGYAGGKLANSIATRANIRNLEALRDSKLAMMDEATVGAVKANVSTVVILSSQISGLMEQIEFLKKAKQYWLDPKSGEVFASKPTSNDSIAVPGYFSEEDEKTLKDTINDIYNQQSDGILSDNYVEEVAGNCETITAKQAQFIRYKQQTAQGSVSTAYPNVPIFKKGELKRMKQDPMNQNNRLLLQVLSWVNARMPDEFNYTGVILRNHTRQGLLHSFLRQSAEWADVIPGLDSKIQKIHSIQQQLREIGNAPNPEAASPLLNAFAQCLSDDDREALSDIQMQLYQFLCDNTSYEKHLEEGVNDAGRVQVFFEVADSQGNPRVLVVCVSNELYPSHENIPDPRPIRTITTVFFLSEKEARKRLIDTVFL